MTDTMLMPVLPLAGRSIAQRDDAAHRRVLAAVGFLSRPTRRGLE